MGYFCYKLDSLDGEIRSTRVVYKKATGNSSISIDSISAVFIRCGRVVKCVVQGYIINTTGSINWHTTLSPVSAVDPYFTPTGNNSSDSVLIGSYYHMTAESTINSDGSIYFNNGSGKDKNWITIIFIYFK